MDMLGATPLKQMLFQMQRGNIYFRSTSVAVSSVRTVFELGTETCEKLQILSSTCYPSLFCSRGDGRVATNARSILWTHREDLDTKDILKSKGNSVFVPSVNGLSFVSANTRQRIGCQGTRVLSRLVHQLRRR